LTELLQRLERSGYLVWTIMQEGWRFFSTLRAYFFFFE
jgi:hypothetical protein